MPNPMDQACWVSPADEKGNVDNLSSRVAKLEEVLSLIMGMNVSASQLSDLTSKAGVLEDLTATAANAAGGWTTDGTFTGVALSTLGWKMSDGSEFPIVTMLDGVLQFGFGKDGQVSGTKADNWDAAYQSSLDNGDQDYGIKNTLGSDYRGMSLASGFANTSTLTSFEFNITRSGLYFISTYFVKPYTGGTPAARIAANHQINRVTDLSPLVGAWGDFTGVIDGAGNGTVSGSLSLVGRMDVTLEDSVKFYVQDASGTDVCSDYGMSVFRISD